MDRSGLIVCLALIFIGCEFDPPREAPLRVKPISGNGIENPDGGVQRTLFRSLGSLTYGEEIQGVVQSDVLAGYVFHGSVGDLPRLDLEIEGMAPLKT